MTDPKTTVIRRKISKPLGFEAKRGGMWKVAYADFITAMMAFFMMLWILSITPENKLHGIAEYFTVSQPQGNNSGIDSGHGKDTDNEEALVGSTAASNSLIYGSAGRGKRVNRDDDGGMMSDMEKQHFMDIMNNIQKNAEIKAYLENINIDVTPQGLRIQVADSDNRPVFKADTYEIQPYMHKVLQVIARMIKDQPNYISISGHTASLKDSATEAEKSIDYWFLSSMRANEIRKFITKYSVKDDQVAWITGKSDRDPFDPKDKYGTKNVRVSIILLNDSAVSNFQRATPAEMKKK